MHYNYGRLTNTAGRGYIERAGFTPAKSTEAKHATESHGRATPHMLPHMRYAACATTARQSIMVPLMIFDAH